MAAGVWEGEDRVGQMGAPAPKPGAPASTSGWKVLAGPSLSLPPGMICEGLGVSSPSRPSTSSGTLEGERCHPPAKWASAPSPRAALHRRGGQGPSEALRRPQPDFQAPPARPLQGPDLWPGRRYVQLWPFPACAGDQIRGARGRRGHQLPESPGRCPRAPWGEARPPSVTHRVAAGEGPLASGPLFCKGGSGSEGPPCWAVEGGAVRASGWVPGPLRRPSSCRPQRQAQGPGAAGPRGQPGEPAPAVPQFLRWQRLSRVRVRGPCERERWHSAPGSARVCEQALYLHSRARAGTVSDAGTWSRPVSPGGRAGGRTHGVCPSQGTFSALKGRTF